jgi:hypothetical protein
MPNTDVAAPIMQAERILNMEAISYDIKSMEVETKHGNGNVIY